MSDNFYYEEILEPKNHDDNYNESMLDDIVGEEQEINLENIIEEKYKYVVVPKLMPKFNIPQPHADFYMDLDWIHGYQNWRLVRFSTPMDGSCLFHAIVNAFFIPYQTGLIDGKKINREKLIKSFRKDLSEKLEEKTSDNPISPTWYEKLNNGNTAEFAKYNPEFSLKNMKQQLNSSNYIGYGFFEFIGNIIDKDIYILDGNRRDIYITDESSLSITGRRMSIVIYYANNHYELVGIQNQNNTFDTHFNPNHTFIKFLYSKIINTQSYI